MIPTVYPDQGLVNFPVASLNYLPNAPYSLTPFARFPSGIDEHVRASRGARQWETKQIKPNTPVNLAPYAAILGPLYGDYATDRMRNGYTISGNFSLEHEFADGITVQASYVANNGVSLYNMLYPNAFSGAEPPCRQLRV